MGRLVQDLPPSVAHAKVLIPLGRSSDEVTAWKKRVQFTGRTLRSLIYFQNRCSVS